MSETEAPQGASIIFSPAQQHVNSFLTRLMSNCRHQTRNIINRGKSMQDMQLYAGATVAPLKGFRQEVARFKFFDRRKGYGFATLPDGTDAFLHATVGLPAGMAKWMRGGTMYCHIAESAKGWHVVSVEIYDGKTEFWRNEACYRDESGKFVQVVPSSDWTPAIVTFYLESRGYGMAAVDGLDGDVMLHASAFNRAGLAEPHKMQALELRYFKGPKGYFATHVRLYGAE